jgi:hypothetical protein
MACLTYNGISLPFTHMESFRMEAVYDDQGRTDKIVTKFDIAVQTLITADALDMVAPAWYGRTDDPALIITAIQEALTTPRRQLSFQFNDFEFLPQKRDGVLGYVDAMNGPLPQNFTPVRLDEKSWLCTYHIIAHYVVNYVAGNDPANGRIKMTSLPGNVCLFNRWEESVTLDRSQYSNRVRRGKCMIRSDNAEGFTADQVRGQMAVVSVPKGFVRERSRYTVSPDGLGLSYEVEDQEVFNMPPVPAFEADGEYEETASRGDGRRIASCWVGLRGPKGVNPSYLARTAAGICAGKLAVSGGGNNQQGDFLRGKGVLLGASVSRKLYDNRVRVQMSVQLSNTTKRIAGAQFVSPGFDSLPVSNNLTNTQSSTGASAAPAYTERGTASLILRAAAYYDPKLVDTVLLSGAVDTPDNQPVGSDGSTDQLSRGVQPGLGPSTADPEG